MRYLTAPAELGQALGIDFSDEQLAAITAPLQPGVIIAGAGSGKTTVMAARVVWLVGTGAVRPEDVLGLTFTRKAAAELAHRVRVALLKAGVVDDRGIDEAGEQVVMTYDAFAGRMVSEYGVRLGVESEPVIVTGATRYRLAARVVAQAAGPFEQLSRYQPDTVINRVLQLDAELTAHLVTTGEVDAHASEWIRSLDQAPVNRRGQPYKDVLRARERAAERLELASLVDQYQTLKQHLGLVEFGDQLAIAARLAQEVPAVSASVRATWPVVLLDEYQDTSSAQAQLLQSLFSGADPTSGRGHAVTAVGDPCQAIYGWRGAAASNITQFAKAFPQQSGFPAMSYELTVNRRSGQHILDVANRLAAPLREDPYTAAAVTDLVAPATTPLGEVHAATFSTWPEEVAWVSDQIVAAHPSGGGTEVQRWADIAVLCRRNADIGAMYSALTARDVPVEIVGLGGLLGLPEVADVVATLRLLTDVTANPEVLRLLSGPRWALGPRDLALLGKRAQELAHARREAGEVDDVLDRLADAVAEVDPTDVVALLDAVGDPGPIPLSPAARQRCAAFFAELGELRTHTDEPLPELVRRVIDTLGLGIELDVLSLAEPGRADHLAAFSDAVATFMSVEADASLTGLLAWLDAELTHGNGLDQAVPSDRESVKLLTIHKAKGLEWELVFLPALVDGVFPSDRVSDDWAVTAAVLPADLRGDADAIPQLAEASQQAMKAYHEELRDQQHRAEHRLAYVAVTRARQRLVGTAHYWRPALARPRALSRYFESIMTAAEALGHVQHRADPPRPTDSNPLMVTPAPAPWPVPADPDWAARRLAAREQVLAARDRLAQGGPAEDDRQAPLTLDEEAIVATWDADLELLVAEARDVADERVVPMPTAISASRLIAARRDPQVVASQLVRPMPRPPSPAADLGIRFHGWVQRYLEMPALVDADELVTAQEWGALVPHAAGDDTAGGLVDGPVDRLDGAVAAPSTPGSGTDGGEVADADFVELCQRFSAGRFGARQPEVIEQAITLTLGDQVVRARIDAVYREPDGGWLVVDWKTHHTENADPFQLAIYRLGWADAMGVSIDQVRAGFYYVRTDRLQIIDDLPDRPALVRWSAHDQPQG